MNLFKAAVVGVGYLGRFHAQKYSAIKNIELVAVCDLDKEQGSKVAEEVGAKYEQNFKKLVGQIDMVTVASTTSSHYELVKFFLKNNIHVNVEKPMTSTVDEAEELCALAKKNNLKLQVGHVERFNPALVAARKKMKTPLFMECHRLAPFKPRGVDVNVVLDLMIHDIDVILSLVKSEPIKIDAVGTPVVTQTIDIANARLEFASGAVANLTASRVSQVAQRKFRVFQKDQYLSIDFGAGEVSLTTKTGEWEPGTLPPIESEQWSLEKGDALLAETEAFVDSVVSDKPCIVSGEDGLVALKIAEQVIRDIERKLN